MTENNVLAGHAMADYENGTITEETVLKVLEKCKQADKKQGYPTDEIQGYIDQILYDAKPAE